MLWMLRNGKNLEWYEDLIAEDKEPPAEYYEQPLLYPDLRETYKIFVLLSSQSRPVGFGVSKIPIGEIKAYLEFIGIDDFDYKQLILERIMILDDTYVSYKNEEQEREKKRKGHK
jgi:hypothetical protein